MIDILQRRTGRYLITLAAWPAFTLSMATQEYLYRSAMRSPIRYADAFRFPLVEYLFWALAAPLIFELADRLISRRLNWSRRIGIFIVACAAVIGGHAIYRAALHGFVYPPHLFPDMKGSEFPALLRYYTLGNSGNDVWLFATIVALASLAHYYWRYRDRENLLTRAQLQVLRAQLQPHFLFNAMNSIATLMHEDVNAADDMLTNLATLLRRTLRDEGRQEVTLGEEMETLDLYLDIQRVRFQDRLIVQKRVAPDTLTALVPPLILQPLAENALRHGLAGKSGPGTLEIVSTRDGDRLRLAVLDDGPGLQPSDEKREPGLGLLNTRARLHNLYGDGQTLEISNRGEGGVKVEILIPYATHPLPDRR